MAPRCADLAKFRASVVEELKLLCYRFGKERKPCEHMGAWDFCRFCKLVGEVGEDG